MRNVMNHRMTPAALVLLVLSCLVTVLHAAPPQVRRFMPAKPPVAAAPRYQAQPWGYGYGYDPYQYSYNSYYPAPAYQYAAPVTPYVNPYLTPYAAPVVPFTYGSYTNFTYGTGFMVNPYLVNPYALPLFP